jgi:transient receptor potential cation channel subfamily M member 3
VFGSRRNSHAQGANTSSTAENTSNESCINIFPEPFNDLLVWAVLTKRQAMAHLMWQHGEQALAKALIANKLYRAMADEAADDDLEVEISDELRGYAKEFESAALELLDFCYR